MSETMSPLLTDEQVERLAMLFMYGEQVECGKTASKTEDIQAFLGWCERVMMDRAQLENILTGSVMPVGMEEGEPLLTLTPAGLKRAERLVAQAKRGSR